MKKLYDLAVANGNYKNQNGEGKVNWLNVGAILENDNGKKMILLDRTFNPAGMPNPDNRTNIIISMFPPKNNIGQASSEPSAGDDDIPF